MPDPTPCPVRGVMTWAMLSGGVATFVADVPWPGLYRLLTAVNPLGCDVVDSVDLIPAGGVAARAEMNPMGEQVVTLNAGRHALVARPSNAPSSGVGAVSLLLFPMPNPPAAKG